MIVTVSAEYESTKYRIGCDLRSGRFGGTCRACKACRLAERVERVERTELTERAESTTCTKPSLITKSTKDTCLCKVQDDQLELLLLGVTCGT
jgi:hypothetical protein